MFVHHEMLFSAIGSIFWGNTDDQSDVEKGQIAKGLYCGGNVTATYSCIQELNIYANTGNIDDDPLFANPSNGQYQLKGGSMAVDSGNLTGDFPYDVLNFDHDSETTSEEAPDLLRHERIIMDGPDMGAYERLCGCDGDMVTSATFAPPPDGVVDAADLAYLLGEWGVNPGSPADIVTSSTFAYPPDGVVDAADLAWLLGSWGTCTEECEEAFGGGGDPFEGTEIGDLLEQLLEEEDEEAAAALAAQLLELLSE